MSHFYFHIYENGTLIWDEEGSECPDLDAAKREAMASATDLARQALARGEPADGLCVEIRDEDDRILAGLTIREVLAHPATPASRPPAAPRAPACCTESLPYTEAVRQIARRALANQLSRLWRGRVC